MTDATSPAGPEPSAAGTGPSARREGARVLGLIAGMFLLGSSIYALEGSDTYGLEGSYIYASEGSDIFGWIRVGLALAVCIVSVLGLQWTTLGLVGASALAWLLGGQFEAESAVHFAIAGLALGLVSVALMPARRAAGGRRDPREIHIATMVALGLVWLPLINVILAHTAQIWAVGRTVNDRNVYGVLFAAYAVTLASMVLLPVPGS